jgi:hypothetical protein
MTFADLKAEILSRLKRLELCEAYQAALLAADEDALIVAAVGLFEWTYQSGVVDDALLLEFTEATLNAHGIYINNVTLTNPSTDVYLIGGTSSVTVNANNKCRIRVMSNTNLTLTIANNGYVDVKTYNTSSILGTLSSLASCLFEGIHQSAINLALEDDTFACGIVSDDATLSISTDDNAVAKLKGFNKAAITYLIAGSSEINIKLYQDATAVETLP